ncbi:hypothetical protein FD724_28980 [Nostoc sp. C057]|uniref:hypothetical protein n=1 Tax=Nostoc sp. C057 TaxID=2576903 RepID=UPI0015C386A2|nr:hypothetical protein [Nostoc sp. C057]QLE51695.1 hypothetical protein FD724_28980 [Nostoc sp. C057]
MIRSDVLSAIALGIYPKLSALRKQSKSDRYQYFLVKGERGKGKGLNLPFPLCPLTFPQTKREITLICGAIAPITTKG